MNKKKLVVISVVFAAVAAGGFGIFSVISNAGAKNAVGIPVEVSVAGRDTIVTTVSAKGEVSLSNTQMIYANIRAEVDEVLVEKNDVVVKNQPILRYKEKTREDLEISIMKAELDVKSAELALSTAAIPPSDSVVERAKLDLDRARRAISDAEESVVSLDESIEKQRDVIEEALVELAKEKTLLAAGAVTQSSVTASEKRIRDLQDALTQLEKNRTQRLEAVSAAESDYRYSELVYKDTVNKSADTAAQNAIKQQQITLDKARLALAQLQRELEDFQSEITSPIDGTVTIVSVSRGEVTSTDRALMEIADVSDYVVKVDINERNAAKVAIGQDVELSGSVMGKETITGKVTKIGYIAETKQNSSGTERVIPIEITADNNTSGSPLKPGFSLEASVITGIRENVVVVPILSTLSESDGSNYVFIIKEDNTLEKREIKIGAYADMTVEAEGIEEGTRIVAQPTVDMHDGMQVIPAEPMEPMDGGEGE